MISFAKETFTLPKSIPQKSYMNNSLCFEATFLENSVDL